ncbi:MAG: HypC/HybG/HupF family hydrogenase formation chaperone [Gammaproteobacteria bacterium]|nr:HypC/HybG/HupF family hydrogenase formation chaperone [Gammaproteobacteria bacterium]
MCLGVPGQIESIADPGLALAWVRLEGVRREVNVACVLDGESIDALVGSWVIVHAGFALEKINLEEATRTLQLLQQLHSAQETH